MLQLGDRYIETDKDGFLKHLADWDRQVAEHLAAAEGITLAEAHWEVITLLQKFYQHYEISPSMRAMVKYIAQEAGKEKGSSMYLLELFPGSPAKLASKIAGLPRPANCL